MKILVIVLLLLLTATPVLAAAAYSAVITVIEGGGVAYPQLPFSVLINNVHLAEHGFIASTGLDTRMLRDGAELPHMLASDRAMAVTDIGANTHHLLNYTTGNTALVDFPVIAGHQGFITVPDAANLEPGNNFEVEQRGWIDTTHRIHRDPEVRQVHYDHTRNTLVSIHGVHWAGQTFIPIRNFKMTEVRLFMDTPGGVWPTTIGIRATSGGLPVGEDLTSTVTTVTPHARWQVADLPDHALTAGVQYAIIVRAPTAHVGNEVRWWGDTHRLYEDGVSLSSNNSGVTWTQNAAMDLNFEVWGGDSTPPRLLHKRDTFSTRVSATGSITSELKNHAWRSPTGFNDPGHAWTNAVNLFDNNTATFAHTTVTHASWSAFVELTFGSARVEVVRLFENDIDVTLVDIDLFYNGVWNNIYKGVSPDNAWLEVRAGVSGVTAARLRAFNGAAAAAVLHLNEFGFFGGSSVSVTATGVATGMSTVRTTADGTNLRIFVDGIERGSTALGGLVGSDTTNAWEAMEHNSIRHLRHLRITTAGVQRLWYQPVSIIRGFTGTADTGFTTTLRDTELTQAAGFWNTATLIIVDTIDGLAPRGERRTVTNFVAADNTLHFPALSATIRPGDRYELVGRVGVLLDRDVNRGVVGSGTTTTLVDTTLTQADGFWNNLTLKILTTPTGLAPQGETATIRNFTAANNTLHFAALTAAVGTGSTYELRNDGTITWGANPPGVTVSVGALLPGIPSIAPPAAAIGDPTFVPVVGVEFAVPGVEGEGFLFYGLFKSLLGDWHRLGGPNISMPYFWSILAVVSTWIAGTAVLLLSRSLVFGLLAYFIGFAVWSGTMGVLGLWVPIVYGIGAICTSLLVSRWGASSL